MASASEAAAGPAGSGEPRPLAIEDVVVAARAIARAFAWHEPWGAWALPDAGDREERLYARVRADIIDRFLPHGECWTIDAAATTLWIPPRSRPGTEAFASRRSESDYEALGAMGEAMRAGDELIASLRPTEEHWYLDTIATEPRLHGRGLGGRLLDHDLEIRDAAGAICALDTHTPENVAFYGRRGFEVTGEGRLRDGPPVLMMVRPARAGADAGG